MIYISTALLCVLRLRVIGFPLNLWVGSQVGLRIGTQILPSTSKLKFKDTAFLFYSGLILTS
jgi:hypothetical protein